MCVCIYIYLYLYIYIYIFTHLIIFETTMYSLFTGTKHCAGRRHRPLQVNICIYIPIYLYMYACTYMYVCVCWQYGKS